MFADVTSANTVGYTSKGAERGKFIILGAQFEQIAGGTKIDGLISGVTGVDWDEQGVFRTTAPQIQIPNAQGGYTTRYYLNDGWYQFGPGDDDWAQKAGWCDGDQLIVEDEYTPGEAMWVKDVGNDANVNVSGAVPSVDKIAISCPKGFSLRANAYPITIKLNDQNMTVEGIAGVDWDEQGAFRTTAPQIQIPNAQGGYTTRYYLNDGWYQFGPGDDDWAQKAGWCDGDQLIVEDEIPAAQGFWMKGVGSAFTLTFNGISK